MSVELLGGRLLAEVQDEGLDELLHDLRRLADPRPRNVLGLPQLDLLLEIFRGPALPSAAQGSRRTSPSPDEGTSLSSTGHITLARGHTANLTSKSRTRPAVIQLGSIHSAAGKTCLCYLLTSLAILPQAYDGKQHAAVWFDTDGRFSATRLQAVLIHYLSENFPRLSSSERMAICNEAFHHLHVFKPQSSSQLLSTLVSLPGYLLLGAVGTTAHPSASRSLSLVVLDSATSFYWQDRFEAEVARFEAMGTDENPGTRSPARLSTASEIVSELKMLQKLFDSTIIFTTCQARTSTMTSSTVTATTTNDGRLLPQEPPRVSPWTAFATLHLTVSQEQVRQFAAQMSLEECQRDQANRLAAIAKGRSIVSVDWSTSDTWASGVRDVVSRLDGQGSFAVRITSGGIANED